METPNAGTGLDVVIVYAFDCTTTTPAWNKMDEVYWLVHEKLTRHFAGSSLGYVYVMSTPNTYTRDMKLVDSGEAAATGYKESPLWRRTACEKNMASGLKEAHKLIRDRGHLNTGVILFFSDGSITKGDYFDGTDTFVSTLPVHTFTLAGDAHNQGLHTVAGNSPGGTFNPLPVPDKPKQSAPFSRLLHSILSNTIKNNGIPGKLPQNVFIVYAFDSTTSTPAYKKVDEIFWMVHNKLTNSVDSCLGYIYVMSTPNTYTLDMKLVDSAETAASYKGSSVWRRTACTKNMASGLHLVNELMSDHGDSNGMILFFSDGLINKGDFFDGAKGFISRFPVHTFTVGGDTYNEALRTIAANSPGGTFNPLPVPDKPKQSAPFSQLLESILSGTVKLEENSGWVSEREDEINMRNLYLYTEAGPNGDQLSIVNADGRVNNGAIYEGLGPNATLVARAQGSDISAGDTSNMFRIVFETERFKGSTLQVLGTDIEESEWAVLGGTGWFSNVNGIIQKDTEEISSDGKVILGLSIKVEIPLTVGIY